MATVPAARAWKREQQVAAEAFPAAANGHQGVRPPIGTGSYAGERGMVPWSARDLLAFSEAEELPSSTIPGPVATISHVNSAAPARDTALAPAPAFGGMPDEAIWMILTIVTLALVLLAVMLVAESV
jgi:hypothetical protein